MLNLSRLLPFAYTLSLGLCLFAAAQTITFQNHQPFPIQMPIRIRSTTAPSGSTVSQQAADDAMVLVDVPANGTQQLDLKTHTPPVAVPTFANRVENGIGLIRGGKDLGEFSWGIVFEKLTPEQAKPNDATVADHRDFDKLFHPLPLKFEKFSEGSLCEFWSAHADSDGLDLYIFVTVYHDGVIDLRTMLSNVSAPQRDVYAALVCRWDQRSGATRSMCYDNHVLPLNGNAFSPFRAGQGRYLMILRGVDWINNTFDGVSIAMLNDFSPSFTVHKDATAKTPAHWTGANTAQVGQEAQSAGNVLYSISEIARPNIKMYASRLQDNCLPAPHDAVVNTESRLFISDKPFDDSRVDQMFIAYAGFTRQTKTADGTKVEFGVPFTRFGTAYFPYSTLGENFQTQHLPGMSGETYWPLAADTVTQYKLFADDIRRDLRIAKAMGFQTIRFHHLEMLSSLPKQTQDEYLDFLFAELKHLGLTALLDVKLHTDRVVELVKKYQTLLEGVEIDNEVLIFGINDEDIQGWKDQYAAIKAVAPNLPVWFTGHTNTGAFARLRHLGVPFDRVGEHAYADSVDAIPSMRDDALEVANYAASIGKESVITEWNWRFLTRMTDEARAKIYPAIFENALEPRCVPEIYQFQFQESLAMAPKTLRGIRHYELLNLSRRPRLEAFEFMKLIDQYGDPSSPEHILKPSFVDAEAPQKNVSIILSNNADKSDIIEASTESFGGLELTIDGDKNITIPPHQQATVQLKVSLPQTALPGFYHGFIRFQMDDGSSSYGWVQYRNPGAPKIDKDNSNIGRVAYLNDALNYDLNRPLAIVYGKDATGWEVESAWYIWETLESATGRPTKIFQSNDLPDDLKKTGNLILVGTPKSNELIAAMNPQGQGKSFITRSTCGDSHGDTLMVVGDDESTVSDAAMDFVLRYWKYAKDSAARRLSLTDNPLGKSLDPNALP